MDQSSQPMPATAVRVETQAEKWGKVAVTFILSGTAGGICAVLAWLFWGSRTWAAYVCCAIAALCLVIFVAQSFAIVKFWIVIARSGRTNTR